ncbi:hypothetical protein HDU77_003549 [Chytriomyces hyalinus]|nr:hypothetical protein HDU77_003549 [Chytriomyces hyalinus]
MRQMPLPISRRFTTVTKNIEALYKTYPVRLSPKANPRRGYFEQYPNAAWHERYIMMPFRLKLAEIAGKGFLNNRFGTPSSSLSSPSNQQEFYPHQFKGGVAHAVPALFSRLSGWDGNIESRPELSQILTPQLLSLFSKQHAQYSQEGYLINFKFKYTDPVSKKGEAVDEDWEDHVTPKYVWIAFGTPSNATSTLLPGTVTSRYHQVAFTRRVTEPKKAGGALSDRRIFREICFEYVYEPGDVDESVESGEDIPDFNWKRSMMLLGQKVGIDSVVSNAELECYVTRASNGEIVAQKTLEVEDMAIRMESSHFVDQFPENGSWKVADVDNALIFPRVLEEEAEVDE